MPVASSVRQFVLGSALILSAWLVFVVGRGEVATPDAAKPPPAVELKVVKYKELCSAIRAQYGKVVVVDVWADF